MFASFVLLLSTLFAQDTTLTGSGLRFRDWTPPAGFHPVAINDNGAIAGNDIIQGPMVMRSDGTVNVLGTKGTVSALNNAGQMVINRDGLAFLRQPDGTMEERTVPGAKSAAGYGVNSKGQVAGSADGRLVIWASDGSPRVSHVPYSAFNPFGQQEANASARAVNDSGVIVGEYDLAVDLQHRVFRTADGLFFHQQGGGRGIVLAMGLSNDGKHVVSIGSGAVTSSVLFNAAGNILRNTIDRSNGNQRVLLGISPNGRTILGANFLAEACPVTMTPPSTSGMPIDVTAGDDCEWMYQFVQPGAIIASPIFQGRGTVVAPAGSSHLKIGGVEIVAAGSDPVCTYVLPGETLLAPSEGGTINVRVDTRETCAWTVEAIGWLQAEPAMSTGVGEFRLTIAPNEGSQPRTSGVKVADTLLSVYQPEGVCTYELDSPGLLGAGSGTAMLRIRHASRPDCTTTFVTNTDWIRSAESQPGYTLFAYEANFSEASREAVLSLGGQIYRLTQEASGARRPLLLEPSNGHGPRSVLRFTYADGALTSQLSSGDIRLGSDCSFHFRRGDNSLSAGANGSCTLNSWQAEAVGSVLTITLDLSFGGTENLEVVTDGRTLGVYRPVANPAPRTLIQPANGAITPLGPAMDMTINSNSGIGGNFRFLAVATVAGLPLHGMAVTFSDAISGAAPNSCGLVVDTVARTIAGVTDAGTGSGAQVGIGSAGVLENSQCVVDAKGAALSFSGPMAVLDVPILFRSTWAGTRNVSGILSAGLSSGGPGQSVRLGSFTVVAAVDPPTAFMLPGLLRVGLPSSVPIERARVVIGNECAIRYVRNSALEAIGDCGLGTSVFRLIGTDLILLLNPRYSSTTGGHGRVFAEQTPQGGIASGLFPLGTR